VDASTTEKISLLRDRVADRIGASRFRTWFGDGAQFHLDQHQLDVLVTNGFVGNWIAANYMDALVAAAREVLGGDGDMQVRIIPAPAANGKTAPATPASGTPRDLQAPAPAPRSFRRAGGGLRGRLEDFVVGPSNRLAYVTATQVVREPGKACKLAIIHGGCGLGKTHLLQGICNGLSDRQPTLEWRYISGEQFTNEFIYAVKSGNVDLFRTRFRSVDVLVIDDIHFLANKNATQKEFLHTFDAIDASGKAVVLSSDRHPRQIGTLSEPLVNRLISGMVVEIEPPDFAVRREIVARRAAIMNCPMPAEVIDFVAAHVTSNVRELEGALHTLVALASLTGDTITLDLAARALAEYVARSRRPLTPESIAQVVADRFGVTREQVLSRSRDRTVTLARAVTMFLVRKLTPLSFPEIGRALGHKNHSTVLMATQRIDRLLREDATVSWTAAGARHEALLRGLLETLERDLVPPRP